MNRQCFGSEGRRASCNGRLRAVVCGRVTKGPGSALGGRLLRVQPGEWRSVACSAGYFALILFGYSLLRPVREAMGVAGSMDDLRWLFVATCIASLVTAMAFGGVVARLDRARFIWVGHGAVALCLIVFIVTRLVVDDASRVSLGYVFYVWLSVVNLFLTSVFWAFMADLWTLEQGKRIFAVIAVGGTLGALAGSSFAWWLAEAIGVSSQLALAATCFLATIPLVRTLDRSERGDRSDRTRRASELNRHDGPDDHECDRPVPATRIGGAWFAGATMLLRSPYLLGTALYVMFLTVSSTLLYFTRAELVVNAREELETRISMFAQMDAWTQAATLVVQLFVTGRMIRRFGIGMTLAMLPLVTVTGFVLLAWLARQPGVEGWQLFGAVTAFSAVHSATRYAIARPTRETLFNVVSTEEKYKSKPVIDVFVYRGGDVAGAWMTGLVVGIAGMVWLALPMVVVWGGLCVWLAAAQQRRAIAQRDEMKTHAASAATGAMV